MALSVTWQVGHISQDLRSSVSAQTRETATVWAASRKSEFGRLVKEMNFHFARRSSSPIWPATQSVSRGPAAYERSRDRARFATWSNNGSKRGTAGRIRSAPEAPANASVIGRLTLAILRMPALATSAGAIHRVPVAALDRLPALATYAYVHHAPPYRCHGGGFTPEFDLMTSARWHHSATDGENALSSPTRSRWIASPRPPN